MDFNERLDKGQENDKTKFKVLAIKNGIESIISCEYVFDNVECKEKITENKNTDISITEEEDTDFGIYKFLRGFMADTDIYKCCGDMSPSLEILPSLAWNSLTGDN